MDLTGKGAPGLKQPRPQARPDYLAAVRQLPCIICETYGERQDTPTAAHHVIMSRYGTRKTPDTDSIPLCYRHHQGQDGIHTRPAWWREKYGLDTDYTARVQDRLAHLLP